MEGRGMQQRVAEWGRNIGGGVGSAGGLSWHCGGHADGGSVWWEKLGQRLLRRGWGVQCGGHLVLPCGLG
jgi:hypothetical protein